MRELDELETVAWLGPRVDAARAPEGSAARRLAELRGRLRVFMIEAENAARRAEAARDFERDGAKAAAEAKRRALDEALGRARGTIDQIMADVEAQRRAVLEGTGGLSADGRELRELRRATMLARLGDMEAGERERFVEQDSFAVECIVTNSVEAARLGFSSGRVEALADRLGLSRDAAAWAATMLAAEERSGADRLIGLGGRTVSGVGQRLERLKSPADDEFARDVAAVMRQREDFEAGRAAGRREALADKGEPEDGPAN